MKAFEVRLGRIIEERVTLTIEATNEAEARDVAADIALQSEAWREQSYSAPQIYFFKEKTE